MDVVSPHPPERGAVVHVQGPARRRDLGQHDVRLDTRGEIIEDLLCVADRIWVEEVVAAVAGLLRGLVHDLVPADGVADHPEVELADARQEHVVRGVGGVQHLVHAEEVARERIRVGVEIAHVPLCSKGRGEHPDGDVSHSGREVEVDVGLHAPSRDAVAPTHLPPAPHDAVCASSRRWTAADDAGRARGLVGDEAGATPVLLAHVHAARRLDAVTPRERRGGYVGGGEVRLCGPALAVVVVPHLPPGPRAPRADRRSADDRAERARRFGAEAGRLGEGASCRAKSAVVSTRSPTERAASPRAPALACGPRPPTDSTHE